MIKPRSGFVKMELQERPNDKKYIKDLIALEKIALFEDDYIIWSLKKPKRNYPDGRLVYKYPDEYIAIAKELNPKKCSKFLRELAIKLWVEKDDYSEYAKLLEEWFPSEYKSYKNELNLAIQMLSRKRW